MDINDVGRIDIYQKYKVRTCGICFNIFDATGNDLTDFFTHLVENKLVWKLGKCFFFCNYNRSDNYADKSTLFYFNAKPEALAPGNELITFSEQKSTWKVLRKDVLKKEFPALRKKFLTHKLKEVEREKLLEEDGTTRAIVLMCFEVARKVEGGVYPLTREKTKEAINKVMRTSVEDYKKMAGWLVDMFDAEYDQRDRRQNARTYAYDKIMAEPSGHVEVTEQMENMKI